MLQPIPVEKLDDMRPVLEPYIERCLAHSPIPHTVDDIFYGVRDERFKVFLLVDDEGVKGICILEVYLDLKKKIMNIYMMSYDEDFQDFDRCYNEVYELAKSINAEYLLAYGRRGFVKTMAPLGWKPVQVTLCKEVL